MKEEKKKNRDQRNLTTIVDIFSYTCHITQRPRRIKKKGFCPAHLKKTL